MNRKETGDILERIGEALISNKYQYAEELAREVLDLEGWRAEESKMSGCRETGKDESIFHVVRVLNFVSESCWRQGKATEALRYAGFALHHSEAIGNKDEEAKALRNYGSSYRHLSDYRKALEYYEAGMRVSEKNSDKSGVASCLSNIGLLSLNLSEYAKALGYLQRAKELAEEIGNKSVVGANLSNIGLAYKHLSDYAKALEYYQEALLINEELGSNSGIGVNLSNIGSIYWNLLEYERALEYYQKALTTFEALGNRNIVARIVGNIGTVYWRMLDYRSALENLQKAKSIAEELGDLNVVSNNLGNIGNVYSDQAEYTKAIEYFEKALAMNEELGDTMSVAINLANYGELYKNEQYSGYDAEKAKDYLTKANSIFEEIGAKQQSFEIHKDLSDLYKKEGKWEECQRHYEKYHELYTEVQSEAATKQAQRFAVERQVAVIQKEQEVLRLKNTELSEMNEKLVELNQEKNEFLGIASHDLKNPLASIVLSASIIRLYMERMTAEQIRDKLVTVEQSAGYMRDIIVNLLDINAIESGGQRVKKEEIDAGEKVKGIAVSYRERAQAKGINIEYSEEGRTEVIGDDNALSQVLQNVISNAVKYSPTGKNIYVRVEKR